MTSLHRSIVTLFFCILSLLFFFGCDDNDALRREQAAREAAEKAKQDAEDLKTFWEVAFFAILIIGGFAIFAGKARRPAKHPETPIRKQIALDEPCHDVSERPIDVQKVIISQPLTSEKPRPNVLELLAPSYYVIDGLNIARSYHRDQRLRIETLLTLCIALREAGDDFLCIFDASVKYVAKNLREGNRRPTQLEVVEKLLTEYRSCFSEVPGGSQADDFILLRADSKACKVISNDRFMKVEDNHLKRYPWILDPHRLIKGRVMDDRLLVPELGIDVPVILDTYDATRRLYALTQERKEA